MTKELKLHRLEQIKEELFSHLNENEVKEYYEPVLNECIELIKGQKDNEEKSCYSIKVSCYDYSEKKFTETKIEKETKDKTFNTIEEAQQYLKDFKVLEDGLSVEMPHSGNIVDLRLGKKKEEKIYPDYHLEIIDQDKKMTGDELFIEAFGFGNDYILVKYIGEERQK